MSKTTIFYIALFVLVIAGVVAAKQYGGGGQSNRTSPYDSFAQCLTDKGALFYGAYWCPHCQSQKAMFENSTKLPYIECSTPDGQGQTQQCIDEEITGYPTWKFADGSIENGVVELSVLAEKTGCELPNLQ